MVTLPCPLRDRCASDRQWKRLLPLFSPLLLVPLLFTFLFWLRMMATDLVPLTEKKKKKKGKKKKRKKEAEKMVCSSHPLRPTDGSWCITRQPTGTSIPLGYEGKKQKKPQVFEKEVKGTGAARKCWAFFLTRWNSRWPIHSIFESPCIIFLPVASSINVPVCSKFRSDIEVLESRPAETDTTGLNLKRIRPIGSPLAQTRETSNEETQPSLLIFLRRKKKHKK